MHVEEEIKELEHQDGDDAKIEEEAFESVREELIATVLPADCDLDCFFARHENLAKNIEHTEEAVLDYFQKHNRHIETHACVCQGGAPVAGDAEPDPGAVEEAAIQEIVHLEEELEISEHQNGDSAILENEVLASVTEELIEIALPAGCDLDCFFRNHQNLKDKIEHTEEAVLEHSQKQKRTFGVHACDCPEETTETVIMAETGS